VDPAAWPPEDAFWQLAVCGCFGFSHRHVQLEAVLYPDRIATAPAHQLLGTQHDQLQLLNQNPKQKTKTHSSLKTNTQSSQKTTLCSSSAV
jgi:hypothetical protein